MPKLTNKYLAESREQLRHVIRKAGPVSDQALNDLIAAYEPCYFPKRSLVIREKEANAYLYFIYKGLVRAYYVREEKEINHWFDSDGDFIGNLYYVMKGKVSTHNYEVLENTWMLRVPHTEMKKLYAKYPELESIAKRFVEQYYINSMNQVIDIKSLSAESRYKNFLRQFDGLVRRIPQKHIANYLSITQETLSRLKAKKA